MGEEAAWIQAQVSGRKSQFPTTVVAKLAIAEELGRPLMQLERDRFELSYATRLNRAAGLYVGWRP
jgi:hypothetical protein